MKLIEFLQNFLPNYEELYSLELLKTENVEKAMIDKYFSEALEHCLRRQRELCALEFWRNAEPINYFTYEKIKQARKPQTYTL